MHAGSSGEQLEMTQQKLEEGAVGNTEIAALQQALHTDVSVDICAGMRAAMCHLSSAARAVYRKY